MLAVAGGGAVGALCRYGVGVLMLKWHPEAGPLGTLSVNVVGCFLIGVLAPLFERSSLPPAAALALITGFCGALTTFSTFSHEVVELATIRQRFDYATAYAVASFASGLAAVAAGRAFIRWLAT